MVPALKGVIFGPVKDWRKGSVKALIGFKDLDATIKTRQYKLADVTNWTAVGRFVELGAEQELRRAVSKTKTRVEVLIMSKQEVGFCQLRKGKGSLEEPRSQLRWLM